jgi:uroporphyrinogen-III synthase
LRQPAVPANDFGLHGKHILITRPAEAQSEGAGQDALAQQLTGWGAQVSWLPLVEIQPVSFTLDSSPDFDWLFFTSKNAVRLFFQGIKPYPEFAALPVAVVGPATAQCVQQFGAQLQFISPEHHAESAAKAFCARYACDGLRVLWPCGALAHPALQQILQAAGAEVTSLVVYQTLLKPKLSTAEQVILQSPIDLLVFTSPSAIDAWVALEKAPERLLPQAPVASLGPRTTQAALRLLGRAEVQANPHTLDALAQSIFSYFNKGNPETCP